MLDFPRQIAKSGEPSKRRLHVPPWVKGMLLGENVWALAMLGAWIFRILGEGLPHSWLMQLGLVHLLRSLCMVIAMPVALGGWLLIWGDNGPPYAWIDSWLFNMAFGVCFYGLLGAVAGIVVARIRRRRQPGT